MDFLEFFGEFFWNFLEEFFCRNVYGGIFLGEIFWEDFFWEVFFGRKFFGGIFWEEFFVNIVKVI